MSTNTPFIDIKLDQREMELIKRRLKELPDRLAKNILKTAVRAAGVVIRDEARRRAPVLDGELRKALMVESKRGRPGDVIFVVGPDYKRAPHAHLVEFGTAEHIVSAGTFRGRKTGKKVLYSTKTGTFYGKSVSVSAPKKPFLRPAADSKAREATDAFVTKIRERTGSWESLTMAGGI